MNIPVFPQSALIDLESKKYFQEAYRCSAPATSDVVFSCLFGWQNFFNYYFCTLGNFLLIYYIENNTMVFMPPLLWKGSPTDVAFGQHFADLARVLGQYARENNYDFMFRYVPSVYIRHLPLSEFEITPDRDNFDYVYLREDLVSLKGQKFSPKRNLIQQFKKVYSYSYEMLSQKNIQSTYEFINQWHFDRKNEMLGEAAYCLACRLLDHYVELNVIGGLLLVEGKIVAATLGTIVDKFLYDDNCFSTAIVHHENALVTYKGAYQMINQLFCAHLPATVHYINREEDLGLVGLRKAKQSYYPARMIEKHSLRLYSMKALG
ncbi:MAG: phosphatidylglycerol lysyltransferase domain-containing protein [Endomicrobiales bacterium]|jgi:hypothetical protein